MLPFYFFSSTYMNMDPVYIVNFLLCAIILIMGIIENSRNKTHLPLFVGLAFGLFGVSHLMAIFGVAASLSLLVIAIRLAAYLLVIYSLYLLIAKKKPRP